MTVNIATPHDCCFRKHKSKSTRLVRRYMLLDSDSQCVHENCYLKRMTARYTRHKCPFASYLSLALTLTSTLTLSTSSLPPRVHAHRHAFCNLPLRLFGNGVEFSPLPRSSPRQHCQSTRIRITKRGVRICC